MTEKQQDLLTKLEYEYVDYIDDLLTKDKNTIISESHRTQFYADVVAYVGEKTITENALTALQQKDGLKNLYNSFMDNFYDTLERADVINKALYRFSVEQKHQENNQM